MLRSSADAAVCWCSSVPLQDMLSDANPMVVANALAAMQEIQEVSGKEVLQITPHTLFKLLAALNECTEWGQVGQQTWECAEQGI